MGAWEEYVLSVVAIALTCGIILQIIPDSTRKELMHIICGVILTVMILQPLSSVRLESYLDFSQFQSNTAQQYLDIGEKTASDARKKYITESCEAYILSKAKVNDTEVSAAITLNDSYLPVFAEIQGVMDAQKREDIERILVSDLGITKENQRWIGNPENSS